MTVLMLAQMFRRDTLLPSSVYEAVVVLSLRSLPSFECLHAALWSSVELFPFNAEYDTRANANKWTRYINTTWQ
jgi:hypothetical protein